MVGRLEPENNAHRVIKAFERVETDKQLVVLGDAPYAGKYIEKLRATLGVFTDQSLLWEFPDRGRFPDLTRKWLYSKLLKSFNLGIGQEVLE